MSIKTKTLTLGLLVGGLLLLSACDGQGPTPVVTVEPAPTFEIPSVSSGKVEAEGRLVPRTVVDLAFRSSGQVVEVLVEEGQLVEAGGVIARLGNRAPLEAAIVQNEEALLTAQQKLQKLHDDLFEEQTAALEEVHQAREAVRDAERELWGFDVPSEPIDIEVARANVALARRALDKAQRDFRPYENKAEDSFKRAVFLNKLSEAQQKYDDAVRQLNRLTGVIVPAFDLEQAETELSIAESRLALAQERYEMLQAGPDPVEITSAEARIAAAESALTASQAALDDLELVTPLPGTVVDLDLTVGQQVMADQPVITIADLSQMIAETTDLNENDVVEVQVGQSAILVPDALPDLELSGTVERISDRHTERGGDITYTVRIRLDEEDETLRWGMTVLITFVE